MTAKSWLEDGPRGLRRSSALARASLCFACVALTGCFDATPEYTVPPTVPPVIITSQVQPDPAAIYAAQSGVEIDFDVPFRADDGGEGMTAYFVRDLDSSAGLDLQLVLNLPVSIPSDPTPFAEQVGRHVPFTWIPPSTLSGCHPVTMVLSRDSNLNFYRPIDDKQSARLTWFIDLIDPSEPGGGCSPKKGPSP